jgi:hypothetical protein
MSCCHHYFTATEGGDDAFVVEPSRVVFGAADAGALAEGAFPQQRLLANSPRPVAKDDLATLFRGAMRYW